MHRRKSKVGRGVLSLLAVLVLGGCGMDGEAQPTLTVGAVPDQDPEKLQRLYGALSDYLGDELGVAVEYRPVTDYAAAVTAFRVGDLDLVWFGGLTGTQARLQVDGAQAIVQREVDRAFHSVFIASERSGIAPLDGADELDRLRGRSFTFGSESSTSGRLMPQHFLREAGISLEEFRGEPGFSGSHDQTIKLVESGTYEVGVVNEQVWRSRVEAGAVDTGRVDVIWRTPAYHDYHWVVRPAVADRFGPGFIEELRRTFTQLDPGVPRHREILDMFGAERFVPTENANYADIERVARGLGKIR